MDPALLLEQGLVGDARQEQRAGGREDTDRFDEEGDRPGRHGAHRLERLVGGKLLGHAQRAVRPVAPVGVGGEVGHAVVVEGLPDPAHLRCCRLIRPEDDTAAQGTGSARGR